MTEDLSRRDWMKIVGAASAGSVIATNAAGAETLNEGAVRRAEILPLSSTSEVFVPPRGRAFNKFSFDFPEPSAAFDNLRFGFIVFGRDNAYAMDGSKMEAVETSTGLRITCNGFTWAGGQEKHSGSLVAQIKKTADGVEIDVTATMDQPVKTVTTIVRGVPRGKFSSSGGDFADVRDNEISLGYPFGGGDLNLNGGLTTPVAVIQSADDAFFTLSSLDDKVRTKRMYFAPGENGYKAELIHEVEGWLDLKTVRVPTWKIARTKSPEAAYAAHYEHLRAAYHFPDYATRPDVPAWLRDTALVLTLHGQHYTGFIFNDYAKQLEILRWVNTQIPGKRVLAFLSSWDGRYYWDYPHYKVNDRMGGDAAFRALITEGQQMGFHMMPMFGMNTANKKQPGWARIADAVTHKVDGDEVDLNWVDWDNDRHQEGWLGYMNLGVPSWRNHLQGRIDEMISRYGVDAYFLDIAGGHINDTKADMHAGMKQMVTELRAKHPNVLCCGEMHYDAMLEFIPLYHSGGGAKYAKDYIQRHAKFFSHLSTPAPGRGSSGVHEAGFGRFNNDTLQLGPTSIPTLQFVDDTFDKQRETAAAVIKKARERAGL
jgi:hypothetical protein